MQPKSFNSEIFLKTFVKILLVSNAINSGWNVNSDSNADRLEFTKKNEGSSFVESQIEPINLSKWFEVMTTPV
jgi:hypothetical protein